MYAILVSCSLPGQGTVRLQRNLLINRYCIQNWKRRSKGFLLSLVPCDLGETLIDQTVMSSRLSSTKSNIEYYFSVRLLSVLRGHSGFSSPPQRPMTSDFEGFSIPDFIHYIYFPILILEKEPVFCLLKVQC